MNIVDMTIHIHNDLLPAQREKLEKEIRVFDGVTLVRCSSKINYGMFVIYDSESISAGKNLNRVRQWDKNATIF